MASHRRRSASARRQTLALFIVFTLGLLLPSGSLFRLSPLTVVLADSTPQTPPFSQNWTNTGLITANDNWSGVPGIEGYLGQDLTGSTGTDPQTILATSSTAGDLTVLANQTATTITNGDVAEFHTTSQAGAPGSNPTIALQGSGTADAPYVVLYLNTTGRTGVNVSYNLRDIDCTADNAQQQVALQYRVGTTGNFTNVAAGYVSDATTGPSLCTLVTPVSVTLPAAVENQANVQVRVITTNAVGNDEWVGVDDISVTAGGGGGGGTPTLNINDVTQAEGSGGGTTNFNFTVSLTAPAGPGGVSFTVNTADGTTNPANAGSDYTAITNGSGSIPEGSSSTTVTVQVAADTTSEPNETFFVNITNVTGATPGDVQGLGTITNDDVTVTAIYNIQGSGMSSPLAGQSVTTTGIVTARRSNGASNNGFYIQDPSGDGNLNTSDAILVFTGSTVPTVGVGDSIQVSGTVTEFESSSTDEPDGVAPPDPKTATEIIGPLTIVVQSTGNTLPAALDATSLNILDPAATSRGAQLEKYEYMRISVPSLTVSQPSNNFGEFWGVETPRPRPFREAGIERGDPVPPADEGPHAGSPPPNVPIWDGNFERIAVDSGAALMPGGSTRRTPLQVTAGTVVTGIVGPLDYAFDSYRIVLDYNVTPGTSGGLTAAVPVPARAAGEFTVAHTNLENFSSSNATKMNKASLAIRNVLRTPDILGLIEVDTAASATALANKVNADAADPNVNYVAYFGETSSTQDIGYLVNSARVTVVGTPTQHNPSATFTYCGTTDTLHDRPSFILTATVPQTGGGTIPVTAILNHTKSLIGVDSPRTFGSCGTGTEGARNREKRRLQAEDIADLIESRNGENLVVLGDLNAFEFNDGLTDVVNTLRGVPPPPDQVVEPSTDRWDHVLTNLLTKLTPDQRYSFTFEGNAQTLDHVLVNQRMLVRNNRFAYARFNADFSDSFASDSTRPEAVSDHDAPVAYFTQGAPQPSGTLIISEYRLRGPGPQVAAFNEEGAFNIGGRQAPSEGPQPSAAQDPADNDEFIEFYNNTNSDITVQTTDGSAGWALVASDGVERFTIPVGTVIPARGHFLATNSLGYSLTNYPGGYNGTSESFSAGDVEYALDIPDGAGLALFNTAEPANFTEANRLDAVGYSTAPALYREGAGFTSSPSGEATGIEYSFLRDLRAGTPKDTGENASDFISVSTGGTSTAIGANLGAPGPENRFSPVLRNSVYIDRLDLGAGANSVPNRVRKGCVNPPFAEECDPSRSSTGTMSLRRRVTNYTGAPITRLRFRIIDISTFPIPSAGFADLRAISSGDIVVTTTGGQQVQVRGTVVEEPPLQPMGGGFNTSWSPTGTISLESPLAAGASFNVQFLLGVQTNGNYRVFITVEALP